MKATQLEQMAIEEKQIIESTITRKKRVIPEMEQEVNMKKNITTCSTAASPWTSTLWCGWPKKHYPRHTLALI
jgi:hypothetical protein